MTDSTVINESNLSLAWAKAVQEASKAKNTPLCVSIFNFKNGINEDQTIRSELDLLLKNKRLTSVRETSETIFPYAYWKQKNPTAENLVSWYVEKFLPRYRARIQKSCPNLLKETYFERLVAYKGYNQSTDGIEAKTINQLGKIIDTYKHYHAKGTNPSPSKYIATFLNPSLDNTNMSPYFKFPCLQQIGFSFANHEITISAFYTIQYLMKRGYGNYLGLCNLGLFMSKETCLPLARINCFVGNPRVDSFNKIDLQAIFEYIENTN